MKTNNPALQALVMAARLAGVIVLMIVAFMVSGMVSGADSVALSPADAETAGLMVLLVSAINALILAYLALRSRWHGWKLAGALFVAQYGIETFMSQIETVVFNQALQLTGPQIMSIFITGLVRALLFAPLSVWILGKTHRDEAADTENTRLVFSAAGWTRRLVVLSVLYALVYFVFGYFVAWQSAELRQFYAGSTEILPFFAHMGNLLFVADPWLAPIQLARGLLWVLIILPVVRMFKGGGFETSFALALALGVLLSDFLLFPNPYMPSTVRMVHLVETGLSMALFGALTGGILTWKTRPVAEPLEKKPGSLATPAAFH